MADPLSGWAGVWTWRTLRPDFPFDAYVDRLKEFGMNATAMAYFVENNRDDWFPDLKLVTRRIRMLNAHGIRPLIYIWNRWLRPWVKDYQPEFRPEWVDRIVEATEGLDLLWAPCLEPLPHSEPLVRQTLARLDMLNDKRFTTHNGNFYVPGADYYEQGVTRPAEFFNGDHHHDWRRQFNPQRQVELVEDKSDRLGLLMVTSLTLDGEVQGLPGWPTSVANWDHDISLAAIGARAGHVEPPAPAYPHLKLAKLIERRDRAILGELEPAIIDRRTRRVLNEYRRLL